MLRGLAVLLLTVPSLSSAQSGFDYEALYTDGLDKPMDLAFAGDAGLLVVGQCGDIQHFAPDGSRSQVADLKAKVRCDKDDAGLIGVAAPAELEGDGWIYVYYTVKNQITQRVSRLPVKRDGASITVDVDKEDVLLDDLPWNLAKVRNSGGIGLAPDGHLFVAVADNGQAHNVQDLEQPHGKLLRIKTDGAMPTDNPSWDGKAMKSLFAVGLGRPWRIGVDSETGDVWIGDRGELKYEEVDRAQGGENFGWPTFEGQGHNGPGGGTEVPKDKATAPIHEYESMGGAPVGVVIGAPYRVKEGAKYALPQSFNGAVPVTDFYSNWLRLVQPVVNGWEVAEFSPGSGNVRAIATGPEGRFWLVEYIQGGKQQVSTLTWNDEPPAVTITSPAETKRYKDGEVLTLMATATDPEEGEITDAARFNWTMELYNGEGGLVEQRTAKGNPTEYTIPDETDIQGYVELTVRVTDSVGSSGTAKITLSADATKVTFKSDPAGVELVVDGNAYTEPVTLIYTAGTKIQISAKQDHVFEGEEDLYTFRKWSDEVEEREREYVIPEDDATVTARYAIHGAPLPTEGEDVNVVVEPPPGFFEDEPVPPSDEGCSAGQGRSEGWPLALSLLFIGVWALRRRALASTGCSSPGRR